MTLVVDTSAVMAIMNDEPEAELFLDAIGTAPALISTATAFEAHCVVRRHGEKGGEDLLRKLLDRFELTFVPFDETQLAAAQNAYSRFGRGSGHPAKLNMGDCFSYALASTRGLPLLFKGDDFSRTDITPALAPG